MVDDSQRFDVIISTNYRQLAECSVDSVLLTSVTSEELSLVIKIFTAKGRDFDLVICNSERGFIGCAYGTKDEERA